MPYVDQELVSLLNTTFDTIPLQKSGEIIIKRRKVDVTDESVKN